MKNNVLIVILLLVTTIAFSQQSIKEKLKNKSISLLKAEYVKFELIDYYYTTITKEEYLSKLHKPEEESLKRFYLDRVDNYLTRYDVGYCIPINIQSSLNRNDSLLLDTIIAFNIIDSLYHEWLINFKQRLLELHNRVKSPFYTNDYGYRIYGPKSKYGNLEIVYTDGLDPYYHNDKMFICKPVDSLLVRIKEYYPDYFKNLMREIISYNVKIKTELEEYNTKLKEFKQYKNIKYHIILFEFNYEGVNGYREVKTYRKKLKCTFDEKFNVIDILDLYR